MTSSFGSEDGPDELMFGAITAAAVISRNRVAVLDGRASQMRIFDGRGRLLQKFGAAGDGPGEFRDPIAMAFGPDEDLFVADNRRRLHRFKQVDGTFRFASTVTLPVAVRDMCFLRGRLITNSRVLAETYAIRVIDSVGLIQSRFAQFYTSPNAAVNYMLLDDRIACDNSEDLIFIAPKTLLGEIRAFRRDGREVWRLKVENFRHNIVIDDGAGYRVESSPNGVDRLLSLVVLPGVGLLAQYGSLSNRDIAERAAPPAVRSVLIDPRTGHAINLRGTLPQLAATRDGVFVAVAEDPFPQISVGRLDEKR